MARFWFALSGVLLAAALVLAVQVDSQVPRDHVMVVSGAPLSTGLGTSPIAVFHNTEGLAAGQRRLVWAWRVVSLLGFTSLAWSIVLTIKEAPEAG